MKKTHIFLDNNVFDFLFEENINIFNEFSSDKFELCITKEIQFESDAIPDSKIEKKQFILEVKNKLKVCSFFSFRNKEHKIENQRGGGFGTSEFSNKENEKFRKELNERYLKKIKYIDKKRHDLYENEADIDLAVRSINHVVLSFDDKKGKNKKEPLNIAFERRYKVVFLREFKESNKNLYNFVKDYLANRHIETW